MERRAIRDGVVVAYDDTSVNLRLRHELDDTALDRLFSGVDIVSARRILGDKAVYNVRLANGCDDIFALCDELTRQDEVIWAEPDHLLNFDSQEAVGPRFPNDPLLAQQWHIDIVGVPITWSLTNGAGTDSVAVAVLFGRPSQ